MELNPILGQVTLDHYVCSACWGHLIGRHGPGRSLIVECHRCGAETPGYVTKYYAETRRSESGIELLDARRNLRTIIPSEHSGKSSSTLVAELGF